MPRMKDEGGRMNNAPAAALRPRSSFILHPSSFRPAFTLTEILIVIALIVLVIALAVPAFNLITGTRSVDAAENLVSAMMSRARAEAIRTQRFAGVAFFRDHDTERTGMAFVVSAASRATTTFEAPGLEPYKAWREFQEGSATARVQYDVGDIVIALAEVPGQTPAKRGTQLYYCTEAHDAHVTNNKPGTPAGNAYWGLLDDQDIDTLVGYDFQYLPAGVGAQTINDPDPTGTASAQRDRYLRNGLILFGGDGQLLHRQYRVLQPAPTDTDETRLHTLFFGVGNNHASVGMLPAFPVYSQLGVVLYDEQSFRNAGWSQEDPLNDNLGYTTGNSPYTGNTYNELDEEPWLDNNALSLMVNRYNGTLIRGE